VRARIDSRYRPRLPLRGVAVAAVALAALTACGADEPGDDSASSELASTSSGPALDSSATATAPSSEGSAETLSLTATEADFSISLDQDDLTAGTYEIQVVNDGDATHDFVVEQGGNDIAESDAIGPGESTTVKVDLTAGEYVFYCSIGNHRSMGMELTVEVT
jgi:plastocyanin